MNSEITNKIKKLRLAKGLNHSQMAEKLNITRSAYQKIEAGDTCSWAKYLNELMEVFETTPAEFFSDIGKKVFNQTYQDNSMCYIVENMHQENKEIYEKLIQSKDEQITLLKSLLEKK